MLRGYNKASGEPHETTGVYHSVSVNRGIVISRDFPISAHVRAKGRTMAKQFDR